MTKVLRFLFSLSFLALASGAFASAVGPASSKLLLQVAAQEVVTEAQTAEPSSFQIGVQQLFPLEGLHYGLAVEGPRDGVPSFRFDAVVVLSLADGRRIVAGKAWFNPYWLGSDWPQETVITQKNPVNPAKTQEIEAETSGESLFLGETNWDADYEAFGSVIRSNGSLDFTPSYTGKQFDEDTGLYYYNARWYEPTLGRFISTDPIRSGDNWEIYALANPLRFVDPTGLEIDIIPGFSVSQSKNGIQLHGSARANNGDPTIPANNVIREIVQDQMNGATGTYGARTDKLLDRSFGDTQFAAAYNPRYAEMTSMAASAAEAGPTGAVVGGQPIGRAQTLGRATITEDFASTSSSSQKSAVSNPSETLASSPGSGTKPIVTGSHGDLKAAGLKDSHHLIQDASVRGEAGYSRNAAPAIQLQGPSTMVGSDHYLATQAQRVGAGGTYGWERWVGYRALQAAGYSKDVSKQIIRTEADPFFMGKLGWDLGKKLPIPGNR